MKVQCEKKETLSKLYPRISLERKIVIYVDIFSNFSFNMDNYEL